MLKFAVAPEATKIMPFSSFNIWRSNINMINWSIWKKSMDFANKWDFHKRLNMRYLKGNNRRNSLVYEHILGKIKSLFEDVQHLYCSRRLPKPHPTAYTQKKKKKSSTQKLKNYSKMEYSNRIVVHLMITCWKVRKNLYFLSTIIWHK